MLYPIFGFKAQGNSISHLGVYFLQLFHDCGRCHLIMRLWLVILLLLRTLFASAASVAPTEILPAFDVPSFNDTSVKMERPSCWPARTLPPGFRCLTALDRFLSTLHDDTIYLFYGSRMPPTLQYPTVRLPVKFTAGFCDLKMSLQINRYGYTYTTNKEILKGTGETILRGCVENERRSGGGIIRRHVPGYSIFTENVFIMDFALNLRSELVLTEDQMEVINY